MKRNFKAIICGFLQSVVFWSLALFVISTITQYYIENYYIFSLLCSLISVIIFLIFANKKNNKILIHFVILSLISFFIFVILLFFLIRTMEFSYIFSANLNSGDSFLLMFTLIEFIVYSFSLKSIIVLILFIKNRIKENGYKTQ